MNTIRNIRPAIARTRTTSIMVKAGVVWGLVSVCEELFHLLFLVGKAWASDLEYWLEKERWFSSGVTFLLLVLLFGCDLCLCIFMVLF